MSTTESDRYSFHNIRRQVFPLLQEAMKKLLDEVSRNEEVTRYQMKLAKKKIYDSCERKFIERQRLRRELGDQYESSDSQDEIDYDHLEMDKEQLEKLIRQRLARDNFNTELLQERPKKPSTPPAKGVSGCEISGLVEIKQNEQEEDQRMDSTNRFSPIGFIADELERLYKMSNKQII